MTSLLAFVGVLVEGNSVVLGLCVLPVPGSTVMSHPGGPGKLAPVRVWSSPAGWVLLGADIVIARVNLSMTSSTRFLSTP